MGRHKITVSFLLRWIHWMTAMPACVQAHAISTLPVRGHFFSLCILCIVKAWSKSYGCIRNCKLRKRHFFSAGSSLGTL